ncbi:DNA methyltransferase 1-associated protein 1 [Portunus trituberculatus]|uniref:DNA methyltransferase 1-associated protein 1 n=1 Tax=Portunus trituberculatus TaxID=210409 RepID=A0A5B7CQ42_PORTR|nr:DNA methyltransferase 1-associated protein 1 [Portunus trituberculatus]
MKLSDLRSWNKMADVRDILELERSPTPEVSKEVILGLRKDAPKRKKEKEVMRRPEGMHRELYALLYSDSNKDLPPLLPTDSGLKAVNETIFVSKRKKEMKKNRFVASTVNNLTGPEGKIVNYDGDHERRRKQQLLRLWDRTPKQIEEEQQLINELRKIEARKKEREKKTQDLQKLISADTDSRKMTKTTKKKIQQTKVAKLDTAAHIFPSWRRHLATPITLRVECPLRMRGDITTTRWIVPPSLESCTGIKFPDIKSSGVSLRSQRMKLPASVGQKKVKAIEQLLTELNLENSPMAVEEVCQLFNDLRSDLVLMYGLRTILLNYVFELQTLKHQCESVMPDKVLEIPEALTINTGEESPSRPRAISEMIDAVATPNTPNRKRKAALEQSNVLKKIKART